MWNQQVDCSLLWKLVETTCEVSPKFPHVVFNDGNLFGMFAGVES